MKKGAIRRGHGPRGFVPNARGVVRYSIGEGHEGDLLSSLASSIGLSRRSAKRLLDERRVFVNGRRVWMAHHAVHVGDAIEVQPHQYVDNEELRILIEVDPYIVVDKPAGRMTNEGAHGVEALLRRIKHDEEWRAVHRLDRETSGCLLFARTPEAAQRIVPLFRERRVKKTYWALVWGAFPKNIHHVASPIDGDPALTHIRILASSPEVSLLEVRIETGRTHQIRRHLLEAGHPIAGDRVYGTSRFLDERARALPRQMLHARRICFAHPYTGDRVSAESPLPADFRAALTLYGLRIPF